MSVSGTAGRYRGPSALGDDLQRFWSLTYTLAATDFKLRFFGSALGYLWSLARPLLLFGTLYLVFTKVVKFGEGVKDYPVYLLSSIVLFTFFSETTSRGVNSLVERENLLRKIRFPRLVIPLAVTLHSLFNLGLNLIVVFILVFASGITPTLDWLQIPLLIVMLVVFTTGVTMLLSALYVRFRDVEPIWEVGLQLLFYGSPVIYVIDTMPAERARAGDVQSDRNGAHPVAPRRNRPDGAHRRHGHWRHRVPADPGGYRGGGLCPGAVGVRPRDPPNCGEPLTWPSSRIPIAPSSSRCAKRIDVLEREQHDRTARANAELAAAQEKSYWLDRWNVDLNSLMRRRGASELRAAAACRADPLPGTRQRALPRQGPRAQRAGAPPLRTAHGAGGARTRRGAPNRALRAHAVAEPPELGASDRGALLTPLG